MNQILYIGNKFTKNKKKLYFFKFLLIISVSIFVFLIFYFFLTISKIKKQEKLSSTLINSFYIDNLYSNNNDYTIITLNNSDYFSVIGIIKIDKLGIKYPILSTTTENLLEISPCRYFGPYPNEIGNLCIVGHNYNNETFFSNLHLLKTDDNIEIYDSKNSHLTYKIYYIYEVLENDVSCLEQNTNGQKEITLITCNNTNGKRLIVKAKSISGLLNKKTEGNSLSNEKEGT